MSFVGGTRPPGAFGFAKGLIMNTNTNTRTLEIKGMTGDSCVQKVTGALKGVKGVFTKSVNVGTATIGADKSACEAACQAIGTAGFTAHEGPMCTDAHTPGGVNPAPKVKPAGEKLSEGQGGGAAAKPTGTSR
jgi:copper chaperone CopZ